jgi:hypothetical protein
MTDQDERNRLTTDLEHAAKEFMHAALNDLDEETRATVAELIDSGQAELRMVVNVQPFHGAAFLHVPGGNPMHLAQFALDPGDGDDGDAGDDASQPATRH